MKHTILRRPMVLAPLLAALLVLAAPAGLVRGDPQTPSFSSLAAQLAREPGAFSYGEGGRVEAVFGVPIGEARMVFYPVSQTRALPDGYLPADLVNKLGHPLRAVVIDEFKAMFAAAESDGAYPVVVSGYRSAEYQATIFRQAVQRQYFRAEDVDEAEAQRRASRFVAAPGHSQHQLGTTADLSSWEIGYGIRTAFGETVAGRWLIDHAWEYGFVFPYTSASEPRTGYVSEPWHLRWVGRPLAAVLWRQGYLNSANPTADDWMLAVEELMVGTS
jgi:hypothetical protein